MANITELMTSNMIRVATQAATNKYAESVRKVTSGFNHSDFQTTGTQTDEILSIKYNKNNAKAFKAVTTSLISRTSQHVTIVQRMNDLAMAYHVELQKVAKTGGEDTDLQGIASRYKDILYQLLMTTDTKNRFIFSGEASDIPPVVDNLDGISVPALNDQLDVQSYVTASSKKIEAAIQDGQTTELGVLAEHPGIRSFLHALLIGENYPASPVNGSTNGQFMKQALELMQESTGQLSDLTGELGHLQKFLEDINKLHEKDLEIAEDKISEVIESNMLEAYQDAKIQEVLIQLLHKTAYIDDIEDFIHQLKI